jgi:ABC transporter
VSPDLEELRLSHRQWPSRDISLAMPAPLLLLQKINLTFGVTPLLSGAELAIAAGDRVCLVGRNGSGKSTLLRIAAGLMQPDAGYRFAQPGATIQYLPQEPDLSGFATTLAYVEAGFSAEATERCICSKNSASRAKKSPPPYQAERHAALPWPARLPPRPISCCWMSRPIIWIFPVSSGWSASSPGCAPALC